MDRARETMKVVTIGPPRVTVDLVWQPFDSRRRGKSPLSCG